MWKVVRAEPTLNRKGLARGCGGPGAWGVLMILTKFCDPEEFDYPLIRRACTAAGLPFVSIETDRQMENHEQAATIIETFRDMMED